jgi:hypothetical protein
MNKDAEAINQFLAWLSQEPHPARAPSGKRTSPTGSEESGIGDLQPPIDPLDSEVEALQADQFESGPVLFEDISSLELGEIPAVQDRFHAIIKRRLRAEIERNPPLFPWESRLLDYESEQPDLLAGAASITFWSAQLKALKLPIGLPEALLLQIFAECNKLADSTLRQGVKLVQAVERFFPDQLPALNHWAGQVLAEPVRGTSATLTAFPQSYEVASPTQQMVLSLLAAQQLLEAMTLEVSAHFPQAQRHWLTAAGELVLEVEYQPEVNQLSMHAQLPCAGRLSLIDSSDSSNLASKPLAVDAGTEVVNLELANLSIGQTYRLIVELEGAMALTFAVHLNAEDA